MTLLHQQTKFNYMAKFPSFLSFVLDNPIRAFFTDRKNLIEKTGIREGMTILEVGCGNGFFTPYLSKAVGKDGKIIAIDLQKEMIEKLRGKIKREGLNHMETIIGDIGEINLLQTSIDFIFIYYCYHELEDKNGAVKKFKDVLKEQGSLFIAEPKFEVKLKRKEKMKKLLQSEGFILSEEWASLFSYYLRFKKKI